MLSSSRYLQGVTRYALYTLLIFTPLARGSVQAWAITIIQMVTLIALTAFLFDKSVTWNWNWIKTPLDKPILILLLLSILATVFSLHHRTSIWSVILLINYITIFYLTIHTVSTRSQIRRLVYIIIGVATFLSVFGVFKLFGANPFPWWDYDDMKYISNALSSTYGNRNHLAGYMEMAIPLVLGLLMTGYRSGGRFFLLYLTFIMLAALALSLSRGGWIGTATGLSFMAFALMSSRYFKRKIFLAAFIGSSLVLTFIVLPSTP